MLKYHTILLGLVEYINTTMTQTSTSSQDNQEREDGGVIKPLVTLSTTTRTTKSTATIRTGNEVHRHDVDTNNNSGISSSREQDSHPPQQQQQQQQSVPTANCSPASIIDAAAPFHVTDTPLFLTTCLAHLKDGKWLLCC